MEYAPAYAISSILGSFPKKHHPRRSEEHTSELQSQFHLVCRLLLEKKKKHPPVRRTVLFFHNVLRLLRALDIFICHRVDSHHVATNHHYAIGESSDVAVSHGSSPQI